MTVRNAHRWVRGSTKPRISKTGEEIEHKIVPRFDHPIFHALGWQRYWSKGYLAAYLDRSPQGLSGRLSELAEDRMNYVRLADYHYKKRANMYWGHFFYQRDLKIEQWFVRRGLPYDTFEEDKHFAHTLMACEIMQEIAIGANKSETLAFERLSLPRSLPLPPVPDPSRPGKLKRQSQISDHGPFAITRKADGKKRYIAALEADTGSMTVFTNDLARSSIARKFKNYIYLLKSGEMKKLYGFNGYIFFVTYSDIHKNNMMRCLNEMVAKEDRWVLQYFIFDTHAVFDEEDYEPDPSGILFTRPKERVDNPPVVLAEEKISA